MLLYKYRPLAMKSMLATLKVVFSPGRALNDPFECRPARLSEADRMAYGDRMTGILAQVARIQYQQSEPPPPEPVETYIERFVARYYNSGTCHLDMETPLYDDVLRIVESDAENSIGMLSLSEARDSQLMWSHYADGHRGFVVGFDSLNSFFHEPSVLGGCPLKVVYSEKRLSWSEATRSPENWYLTKSIDWRYEREWRVLRNLDEASGSVDPLYELDHFGPGPSYFDFPASAVQEIIFGARMLREERDEFIEDLSSGGQYGHVELLQALPDPSNFRMTIQKV